MDIAPVGNVAPQSRDETSETASSEEMSQFLRLLTTQIENQDPLEPLDANQFIEQLATINGLEQQIETNRLLREMVGVLRDGDTPDPA